MKKLNKSISIGLLSTLAVASPVVVAVSCGHSGGNYQAVDLELNWDNVNVIFGGRNGLGKAELDAPSVEHVSFSLDKSNHLEFGETVTVTASAENGYLVNGKQVETKEYRVQNLISNQIKNINLTAENLDVEFIGNDGSGLTKLNTINPGISFEVPQTNTLSNGDKVTITTKAKSGYTINNKQSDTFEITVSGLGNQASSSTNLDLSKAISVGEFIGWDGAATFNHDELKNDDFYTISDPVFPENKKNGHLSNGDTVTITFTPTPGHTINGSSQPKTYTYTASNLPTLPVQDLQLTNDDFSLEYGWVGDKLRVSVACTTWFVSIDTHTPPMGITPGSTITLEVTPDLGFTINGKTSETFTFTANDLPPRPDQLPANTISVSSESFGIGFPGEEGARTTTIVERPPHVNISLDRTSGLTTGDNVVLTATPEEGYVFANGKSEFVHTYSVREPGLYDLIEDNEPVEYLWVADDPAFPSHTWEDSLTIRDAQFGIYFPKSFAEMTPWDFGMYLVNMYNNAGSGIMDLTMQYKGHEDTVHVDFKDPLLTLISTFAEADITPDTPRSSENMLITAARMGLDDITNTPKLLEMFILYGNDLFFPTDHNQGPITGNAISKAAQVAQLGLRIASGESEVANQMLPAVAPFPDSTLGAFSNLADIFTEMTKGFADSEVAHAWAADQDQKVQDELGTRENCMMANTYIRLIMLDAISK